MIVVLSVAGSMALGLLLLFLYGLSDRGGQTLAGCDEGSKNPGRLQRTGCFRGDGAARPAAHGYASTGDHPNCECGTVIAQPKSAFQ